MSSLSAYAVAPTDEVELAGRRQYAWTSRMHEIRAKVRAKQEKPRKADKPFDRRETLKRADSNSPALRRWASAFAKSRAKRKDQVHRAAVRFLALRRSAASSVNGDDDSSEPSRAQKPSGHALQSIVEDEKTSAPPSHSPVHDVTKQDEQVQHGGAEQSSPPSNTLVASSSAQSVQSSSHVQLASSVGSSGSITSRRASMTLKMSELKALQQNQAHSVLPSIVDSTPFAVVTTLLTLWALFGPDLSTLYVDSSHDTLLQVVMLVVALLFLVELVLVSYVHRVSYYRTFYFYMDIVALLSLVPEFVGLFGVSMAGISSLTLARVGRAVRAAARTSRISRLSKLFEIFTRGRAEAARLEWLDREEFTEEEREAYDITEEITEPSLVGDYINDRLFKTLFIGVLLVFVAFSVLQSLVRDFGLVPQAEGSLRQLSVSNSLTPSSVQSVAFPAALSAYLSQSMTVLSVQLDGVSVYTNANERARLRDEEMIEVTLPSSSTGCAAGCKAEFSIKEQADRVAVVNMLEMAVVIFLLVCTQVSLSATVRQDLVRPVERMVAVVKLLALNPLATLKVREDFHYETGMLETMLTKLGLLLQLGFGAAGTDIISRNLSASGELMPILPGKRVEAIFGFCDIREFTTMTETLQEDVMIFTNAVADIVHGAAVEHGGFPNKNIGDAFLLVWSLPAVGEQYRRERCSVIAEQAIEAMLECRRALQESATLTAVLEHVPGKDCVRMGFGLHMGYAIAGAIGSSVKVDASYLSPHVNLSSRLESATKQYGVDILFSHTVYDLLRPRYQERVVRVDRAMLKGSKEPLTLYTIGIEYPSSPEFDAGSWHREYDAGVEAYIKGDWAAARTALERSQVMFEAFRPAEILLEFMAATMFNPPDNWAGARNLLDK